MVSSLAAAVAAASSTPSKAPAPKVSSLAAAAAVATTTEKKEGKKPAPEKAKYHAVRETPHNNPPKASGNNQDKTGANVSQKKKASPHHGKINKKKEPHKSEENGGSQQQSGDNCNNRDHHGASSKKGAGSHQVNSNRGQLRHDNKKHVDAKHNHNLIETGGKHPPPGNRGNNASRTGHPESIRSDPQGSITRRDDNKPRIYGSRAEALKNAQGSRRDDGTSKNNYKQGDSRVNNATTNSRGGQRGKSRRDENKPLKHDSRLDGLKDDPRVSNTKSTSTRWNKSNDDISDRNNSGGMSHSRSQNIQDRSAPPPRIKVSPLRGRWADESDEDD